MAENFPNLIKPIYPDQAVQWISGTKKNTETNTKHIIIKILKINDKEKNLKAARAKRNFFSLCWGLKTCMESEIMQALKKQNTFKIDRKEYPKTWILYPTKKIFQKLKKNKDVFRHVKAKRIHHQQTGAQKCYRHHSGKRKIIWYQIRLCIDTN